MSGEEEDGRTVFVPSADPDRTVFEPAAPVQPLPVSAAKGIKIGDILNHIFEVKRFIARGGMGEVFEGANAITEERVAIKVMLPSLAADPNVISLFRREAKTLTRLHHEAVVQYRVLAQEPQLGVLYIVTEYIDGTNLSDVLGTISATPAELAALLQRLASGLRAAHALGAIHRDISPDNVLLGDGKLARAKIIDFGIAKDLDPGTATIVGDGFAGKLGYVAPEQLGDFNRRLGPWTDVYSLALVILAVAKGRDVGLGGSLVDAVDKRRAGPDLSAAPDTLRPLLEKMTRADPDQRLASMDAVLAELAAIDSPMTVAPVSKAMPRWMPIAIGAGVVLVILAALAAFLLVREKSPGAAAPTAIVAARDPVEVARNAINSALPSVNCTWLRVAGIQPGTPQTKIALTGVAGNPSMAQAEISHALASQGVGAADLDFSDVSPITQAGCAALDAYRQISARDGNRLNVAQRRFEMRRQPPDSAYPGTIAASAVIGIAVADPTRDFTLVGLEPSGKIDMLIPSRAAFAAQVKQSRNGLPITDLGGDRYRLQIDLDHEGWSGLLLVSGTGPFDPAIVAPSLGARDAAWRDKLVSLAAERGWQADMVWFKSVNDVKD
ncbi:serine/threonine-protein kinase [Sphingomonas endolithica]|uniref:serine/threonine-protein kinase n=1 Tax=Sphingomonas endolithica TaxID=2972485 RepID=UPI0021AE3D4D|nr:serine/threonine-protein kinase [Sphingomonas sp. ZFBP2030]